MGARPRLQDRVFQMAEFDSGLRQSSEAAAAMKTDLSVLIVLDADGEGLKPLLEKYRSALGQINQNYEVCILFDEANGTLQAQVASFTEGWPEARQLPLRPWTGEDNAIKIGVSNSRGDTIMILPGWPEIEPNAIPKLIDALGNNDLIIARRSEDSAPAMRRMRARVLHRIIHLMFGKKFNDVFCRARVGRREVMSRASELGVRVHFIPLIAASEGFRVTEIEVPTDTSAGDVYKFKAISHLSALTDILTLYIALKYLRRPMRFFGAIGVPMILLGFLFTSILVIDRLFFGTPLGDRPALVFGVLLFVIGVLVVALGLVGEIVIYSSSRQMKTHDIEKVLRSPRAKDIREPDAPPDEDEAKT